MSSGALWAAVLAGCLGCYLLKLAGLSVPAAWVQRPWVDPGGRVRAGRAARRAGRGPGGDVGDHLVVDGRLVGLAVAALALALRAPFIVVLLLAGAAGRGRRPHRVTGGPRIQTVLFRYAPAGSLGVVHSAVTAPSRGARVAGRRAAIPSPDSRGLRVPDRALHPSPSPSAALHRHRAAAVRGPRRPRRRFRPAGRCFDLRAPCTTSPTPCAPCRRPTGRSGSSTWVGCKYCDAAGLRALGDAYRRALVRGRTVVVQAAPPWLCQALAHIRLDSHVLAGPRDGS